MTSDNSHERAGVVTRGDLEKELEKFRLSLETGEIRIPLVLPQSPNLAGGTNHCPNSDLSYSTLAATVPGTLPGDVDDLNYEAFGFYWIEEDADAVFDDEHALKSVDHTLYAAGEGVDTGKPVWDRVNGWIVCGSLTTQYDIVIKLPTILVGAGQHWFVHFRVGALDAALVPGDVEVLTAIWFKTATDEGVAEGSAFDLNYEIGGTPGAAAVEYRVLAKTDSRVSILSNVLAVANAPAVLSSANYVKLFFNPGEGFIEFLIYKKVGASYYHIYTVRNSSDLQYNDTGVIAFAAEVVSGWPAEPQDKPQALAQTRGVLIGAYGADWKPNGLRIDVPAATDFSDATEQHLRIRLTAPTGVDRHIGIDRIWFSPTYNEWSPDPPIKFSDGTTALPSISPTSGSQGSGGGVIFPPDGGSGGPTCVVVKTPIRTRKGFRQFQSVRLGEEVKGDERLPYLVMEKQVGVVSEFYEIRTGNGITIECSVDHPFALSVMPRKRIQARHVKVGTRLACEVKGRKRTTTVVSIRLVPKPAEVGTFSLRHAGGLHPDGQGMYLAGCSKEMDRALFCFNMKPDQ